MIKKLLIVSFFAFALILTGCGSEVTTKEEKPEEVEKETTKEEAKEDNVYPTIAGTQAYDVIISIEDTTGIPKPETQHLEDTFQWIGTSVDYGYAIEAGKNHEIGRAQFFAFTGDIEYLKYCATIPSKNIESEKAKAWVEDNAGKEATTEFGDAIFKLEVGENDNITLTIQAKDYDGWLNKKLDKVLGA